MGLLIYQLRSGFECPNKEIFRCIGCTESGLEKRKKVKNTVQKHIQFYVCGKRALIRAKSEVIIHNISGYKYRNQEGKSVFAKSIVTEFPINGKYLLNNISDNFNCAYVREGSGDCPSV